MQILPFEMKPPSTSVYRFQNLPRLSATSVNHLATPTASCTFTDFCGHIYDVHYLISDYFAQILFEVQFK